MGKRRTRIGLTSEQAARRAELVGELHACEGAVQAALANLQTALAPYNAVLDRLAQLAKEVSDTTDAAFSERSDAWGDTAAGGAADDFWRAWDDVADGHRTGALSKSWRVCPWRLPLKPPEIPKYSDLAANLPEKPTKVGRR